MMQRMDGSPSYPLHLSLQLEKCSTEQTASLLKIMRDKDHLTKMIIVKLFSH